VCLSVHRCICVEKKNQLDATEWFIALIICSACFGNFYAHHQELETIGVLLPPMVCTSWLLVVGVRCRAAGYESRKRDVARLSRATSLRQYNRALPKKIFVPKMEEVTWDWRTPRKARLQGLTSDYFQGDKVKGADVAGKHKTYEEKHTTGLRW